MRILILILIFANVYADDFYDLRQRHIDEVADFSGQLESKSADLLINKKIKKPYRVAVNYSSKKGIELLVKDTEPFYEYALESYAKYVNNILCPIIDLFSK